MKIKAEKSRRMDQFLAGKLPDFTRSHIAKMAKDGEILVNGVRAYASTSLADGDLIELPDANDKNSGPIPKAMQLDLLFENDDFAVINKPSGLTVHPGSGRREGTLVSGLMANFSRLSSIGGLERPGIVHRLDKDTSGLILVAKNDECHAELKRLFKERKIKKTYLALVWGKLQHAHGMIEAAIGRDPGKRIKMALISTGRPSATEYKVMKTFKSYSLLKVMPITGRTHQIRVHLSSIGHPVAGDSVYANRKQLNEMTKDGINRLFLHAQNLSFVFKKKPYDFSAPLPRDLIKIEKNLAL